MKSGPIVAIEDDEDDMHLFRLALKELTVKNEVVWFQRCEDALAYLQNTTESPFVILCDVNLPGMSGIEFKSRIDKDEQLLRKSVPFIFYSTAADQKTVNTAYLEMTVQGFFKKPSTFDDTKRELEIILAYWTACWHPNTA